MDLPANLAEVLQALTDRLQEHENRAAASEQVIVMLRAHNRALQQRLDAARNIQNDDASSVSSQSSHPQPQPAANPNAANDLLLRLITAQETSNRLQQEAREADRRARVEEAPVKFPKLQCLSAESVDSWYTRLMPMLSREKYRAFYDDRSDDILPDGRFNPGLNAILFSEVMSSLSNSLQDYIYSQPHLYNDGVAVIRDIKSTYDTPWTQAERDSHQIKWVSLRKDTKESLQDFFARCMKVRNVSLAHNVICTDSDLRHRFIMGLPP